MKKSCRVASFSNVFIPSVFFRNAFGHPSGFLRCFLRLPSACLECVTVPHAWMSVGECLHDSLIVNACSQLPLMFLPSFSLLKGRKKGAKREEEGRNPLGRVGDGFNHIRCFSLSHFWCVLKDYWGNACIYQKFSFSLHCKRRVQ